MDMERISKLFSMRFYMHTNPRFRYFLFYSFFILFIVTAERTQRVGGLWWRNVRRVNTPFYANRHKQTHSVTMCIKAMELWESWLFFADIETGTKLHSSRLSSIDKRCVGENVKMIVNGIRDWMYRCHYIGKFFYVIAGWFFVHHFVYFCAIHTFWYQSVRINEFLFHFLERHHRAVYAIFQWCAVAIEALVKSDSLERKKSSSKIMKKQAATLWSR